MSKVGPTGRETRPSGEHLIWFVQTSDNAVIHNTQRKAEAIDMADELATKYGRLYLVTEARLHSGDTPTIIHRAKPKEV